MFSLAGSGCYFIGNSEVIGDIAEVRNVVPVQISSEITELLSPLVLTLIAAFLAGEGCHWCPRRGPAP